jgi:disulfide bond formation protein DsbB
MKIYKATATALPLLAFASSLVLEYFFAFKPCNLCLLARYAYLFAFIIFALNYCIKYKNLIAILQFSAIIFGIGISIYHKLVQHGFFSTCHFFNNFQSQEQFTAMVQNAIPCTAKILIFGIDAVWLNIAFFGSYTVIFTIPKLRKLCFN